MEPRPTSRAWADASLLLTTILWGVNISVVKWATFHADPLAFNALRLVVATLTLGVIARFVPSARPAPPLVSSSDTGNSAPSPSDVAPPSPFPWLRAILFASLNGVVYPLLFMYGIQRTEAGNTALLLATMPIWTAGFSRLFLGERLPRLTWIGLLTSLSGTIVVIAAGGRVSLSLEDMLGNLLILMAAMAWGGATVVSGPLMNRISPLRLAFYTSLATTPLHLILYAGKLPATIAALDQPMLLAAFLYSGALSTGVAYATWHYGVSKLGASHAAVYQNLVTLVAVTFAVLVLGEALLASQVVGGAILFVGLYLMRRGRRGAASRR